MRVPRLGRLEAGQGKALGRHVASSQRGGNALPRDLLTMGDEADEPDDGRPDEQAHRTGCREDNRSPPRLALGQPDHRGGVERSPARRASIRYNPASASATFDTSSAACSTGSASRSTLCDTVSNQRRLLNGIEQPRLAREQLERAGDRPRLADELLPRGRRRRVVARARPGSNTTR